MPENDVSFIARILDQADRTGDVALRSLAIQAVASLAPVDPIGVQRPGYPGMTTRAGGLDLGWAQFIDTQEYVTDLKWPMSVQVFKQMRTDSQLSGLYRAMTYPIRRFKFMIDENGARPEIVQGIADDLNLDIQGREPKPRGRTKGRFSFDDFRFHALLALIFGHYGFEQLGKIQTITDGGDGLWHLRKLDPRPPDTIWQINVADDGGLISVRQNISKWGIGMGAAAYPIPGASPEIPVDRLVWFPWEKEGANWIGRSMFRDCYKNWLTKDRLIRVDAINHERAGGIHIAKAPQGASPRDIDRLNEMAQSAIVAEGGGGAIPFGADYNIHKIGSGTDVINSIKYHDESMARLFLHMFIQLGQTETGSRALGLSFIEYAFIAQKAVASWFVDVTNEHVIEDWVDWNYGEDEQAPILTYIVEEEDEHLAVKELTALIAAGAIQVDEELEDSLREHYKLPPRDQSIPWVAPELPATATAVAAEAERAKMADAIIMAAERRRVHEEEEKRARGVFSRIRRRSHVPS